MRIAVELVSLDRGRKVEPERGKAVAGHNLLVPRSGLLNPAREGQRGLTRTRKAPFDHSGSRIALWIRRRRRRSQRKNASAPSFSVRRRAITDARSCVLASVRMPVAGRHRLLLLLGLLHNQRFGGEQQ